MPGRTIMCGRYTLKTPGDALAEQFGLDEVPNLRPRYNIAPSQDVVCLRSGPERERSIAHLRWGLVPFWAKDPAIGNRMINARAETVADKPAFRAAFRKRRCLILADGFYEWARDAAGKQPWFISLAGGGAFAFAGLWETWKPRDGEDDDGDRPPLSSCTIITTEASDRISSIHHRMPVILPARDHTMWLDPGFEDIVRIRDVLRPNEAPDFDAWPVSTVVNSPRNDDPACVARIDLGNRGLSPDR